MNEKDDLTTDNAAASAAMTRLTASQRALVGRCLLAIVSGPYVRHDDEFHTIMGVNRLQATEVARCWPDLAPNGHTYVTVSNTLNNLVGYPHRRDEELEREIDATRADLVAALLVWRAHESYEPGGRGHFDALM